MILLIVSIIIAILCVICFLLGSRIKFLSGGVRWGCAIAAVLFAVFSGIAAKELHDNRENYNRTIYMAAKYMSEGSFDMARLKLNSLSTDGDARFEENTLRCMLSRLQGDEVGAKLLLQLCQKDAGSHEAKQTMVSYLQNNDITQQENLIKGTNYLLASISKKPSKKWVQLYMLESSAMVGGFVPEEELDSFCEKYGAEEGAQLRVALYLATGDVQGAFQAATKLVEKRDSKKNRLLLAETMAQLYYTGATVSSSAFQTDTNTGNKPDAEVTRLQKKGDKLSEALVEADTRIEAELDESKRKALVEQRDKLALEWDELNRKQENIYLYRAINSMEGCMGLEPDIMTAKLYFAAGENRKATDIIKTVSAKRMNGTANSSIQRSMARVTEAFSGAGATDVDNYLLADIENILMSTGSDIVGVSSLSLTKELAAALMSQVKYNANIIHISGIDASAYPKLSVMVSGSEEMLAHLADKGSIVSRDTRHAIDYTLEEQDSAAREFSTCFVVDESGSMDGSPIENAKAALSETVKTMTGNTKVAIVGYDSDARVISPVTNDLSALLVGIATLGQGGGTDIGSGLISGLEVLENAPGVQSMVLMTDGQDNQSSVIDTALETAKSRGIVIYTVGFGDVNDELLLTIASSTGGQYIKAESSSELTSIYYLLQSFIGNSAKLSYTVSENLNETDRYLYLGIGSEGYYARRTYTLPTEKVERRPIATLSTVSPSVIPQENTKNGVALTLNGEGMDLVTAVRIDGDAAVIDGQSAQRLNILLDSELQHGIYSLELELSDGSKLTNPMAFAVGDRVTANKFHIGNLLLNVSMSVAVDETTLAIGNGIRINDSIRCDNLLVLELPQPLDIEERGYEWELGRTGTMRGCTDLYIRGSDYGRIADATYRAGNEAVLVATGEFACTIASDSSSIRMNHVQEEVAVP